MNQLGGLKMGKEWKKSEKVWDFGIGQTKIWIEGENLFFKVPGRQNTKIKISTIGDVIYRTLINGLIEIFSSGTRVAQIRVPKNKEKISNDFADFIQRRIAQ